MITGDSLKLFHVAHTLIDADLKKVERDHRLDLGLTGPSDSTTDDADYLQFQSAIRLEAAGMAAHYELFYCLENSIRDLVSARMVEEYGSDWWDHVPDGVKANAEKNKQRESDEGVTARSDQLIDYTTFGELLPIIQSNWDLFGDMFNSRNGLTKVLSGLNLLRAPIAHCSPLAEDEVVRLRLAVRDWFRLMA